VIESSDINGVKITLNGALSFKNLEISDGLASGDKKRLENELMRAVNAAIKKAQIKSAEKMKGMLPGLPGF
jgi:DNA-binding protein YbaB